MRILFLTPYPEGEAPSQRFRFEQYLPFLKEKGYVYTLQPFLLPESWRILYQKGNILKKAWGIGSGFFRRTKILFSLNEYNVVFIHREASPIGPPIFEWLIAKVWKKPIIYDFDDSIWLPNTSAQNLMAAGLKYHGKVGYICKWSQVISAGNEYLAAYARTHSAAKIVVNPTTIDTHNLHNQIKDQETKEVVIGWTGTHSTLHYLKPIEKVMWQIAEKHPQVRFNIISNQPPDLDIPRLKFIPWNKEREIEDLLTFNIGIMPLSQDQWSEGKCGFKALQYMALGIPPIVSPVGVNKEIIQHRQNGFIANTSAEWLKYLNQLIEQEGLRKEVGEKARQTVSGRFSVEANAANFLGLFVLTGTNSTIKAAT